MQIIIVGRADAQRQRLERLAREVAAELRLQAQFEVVDPDALPGDQIAALPALVIDGMVKAAGRLPSRNEIGSWLQPSWV